MNQIITVPDIAIVKTMDGTKKLLSLRDQKIKKDTLHTFGAGSGVKYNGDLYVLDDIIEPIVRMVSTKAEISCTAIHTGDIEVDWGDGTREKNVFKHSYSDGLSEHEIRFYGGNDVLTELNCEENQLTLLDVSNNMALTDLDCDINQLSSLDVSKNLLLENFACQHNQLESLDVSRNISLTYFACGTNKLTALDVSKNVALISLYCGTNQLTTLDVSRNISLKYLGVSTNQLTTLDVSNNVALMNLMCTFNPILTIQENMIAFANTLPQKEVSEKATIELLNETSATWIRDICSAKNWNILR